MKKYSKMKFPHVEKLEEHIANKLVTVRKHPTEELYIYNYSATCQFGQNWDDVTEQCRGLIMDKDYNIVARPFRKFHNLDVNTVLPLVPYEVFEKMDGSLLISYWIGDTFNLATRGSFESDQALEANKLFNKKYSHVIPKLDKSYTYLFEFIAPWNKIVVDYEGVEDVVLLAVIDTVSGSHLPLSNFKDLGIPVVKSYITGKDLMELGRDERDNAEGYVVRFANDFMVKIKFETYKKLHRLITGVSNVTVWECLKDKTPFEELIEGVPDEQYNWLMGLRNELISAYAEIENTCKKDFVDKGSRKENALFYKTCKYPAVLFNMLDGKPYDQTIWKMIKPKWERPFVRTAEIES
jgi:RNA ligase